MDLQVEHQGVHRIIRFDESDAPLVLSRQWRVLNTRVEGLFYAVTGHGSRTRMHNLIMGITGIDHINHDGLDNRRINLRPATAGQQRANQRIFAHGSSQYKGVYLEIHGNRRKKWKAVIQGKTLGYFETEEEAAGAYNAAALDAWGEYANLNII